MFVVDTNVLVYAADRAAPEHGRCREQLRDWCRQVTPWHLTWGIVYEFLRVVTHPRVFRRPWSQAEAWSFVKAVLASPGVEVLVETERHGGVIAELVAAMPRLTGNLFHDAHTAALMREHGVRTICTRDTDFHRFPEIDVRDPLD